MHKEYALDIPGYEPLEDDSTLGVSIAELSRVTESCSDNGEPQQLPPAAAA